MQATQRSKGVTVSSRASCMTGYVYDEVMLRHRGPSEHPERPARIRSIYDALERDLLSRCVKVPSRKASREEVESAHSTQLVDQVLGIEKLLGEQGAALYRFPTDEHTYCSRDSAAAALTAVAGVVDLTEKVCTGELRNGFAIVRPPGHHACANKAMGFCLFNNIAIAGMCSKLALARHDNIRRILIVDWDVHHGNGTADIFADSSQILYMSIHRYEHGIFFPGTGHPNEVGGTPDNNRTNNKSNNNNNNDNNSDNSTSHDSDSTFNSNNNTNESGRGYTVNIGWNKTGMTDSDYQFAFDHVIVPIAAEFQPDLVLVSAGFDACEGDIHGEMHVTAQEFGNMTKKLLNLASGKVVVVLEGGYNLQSNVEAAEAVVKALMNVDLKNESHKSAEEEEKVGEEEEDDKEEAEEGDEWEHNGRWVDVQDDNSKTGNNNNRRSRDNSSNNSKNNTELPTLSCVEDVIVTLRAHEHLWLAAATHLALVEDFREIHYSNSKGKKDINNNNNNNNNNSNNSNSKTSGDSERNDKSVGSDTNNNNNNASGGTKNPQFLISRIPLAARRTAEAIWKDTIFKLDRKIKEIQQKLQHIRQLQQQTESKKKKLCKHEYTEIGNEEQYMFELEEAREEVQKLRSLTAEEAILLFLGADSSSKNSSKKGRRK